jgi:hypothetical protein
MGFFFLEGGTTMWITIGSSLCHLAKLINHTNLYNAARHSFRSGRPELFGMYWRYYQKGEQLKYDQT